MTRAVLAGLLLVVGQFAWSQDSKVATLYANKIYCEACAAVIARALRNVPGVSKVNVDVPSFLRKVEP